MLGLGPSLDECAGDVGGQRTLRPYWRNYFEQTDAIVWVVDSGDRLRMEDCKEELHTLLQEDVKSICSSAGPRFLTPSTDRGSVEHPYSYSRTNRISMER